VTGVPSSATEPAPDDAGRDASFRVVAFAALAVLAASAVAFVVASHGPGLSWLNSDASCVLRIGKQMAHGRRLYADQFEVNPPAAFLATEGVARVAEAAGAPVVLVWHLSILALGGAGAWLLVRSFPRSTGVPGVVAVCGAYVAVVLAGGTSHFGQRPHLFMVAFLPYFFLRITGDSRVRGTAAWCAAVGFLATMKPYYVLQVLVVEASAFAGRRRAEPGVRVPILAGALAPLALLWLHSPESFDEFFTRVVPFVAGGSYDAYRGSATEFLRSARHARLVVLAAVFALAAFLARRAGAVGVRAVVTAAVAVAVAYASIFHQHKFWAYHCLTTIFLTATFAAWLGAAALHARTGRAAAPLRTALAAAGAIAAVASAALLCVTSLNRQPPADGLVALCGNDRRVFDVTPTVDMYLESAALEAGFELVGGATPDARIGKAASAPDPNDREKQLRELVADLGAVIDRERPSLVVVSTSTQAMGGGDAHQFLVGQGGLFPRDGYRRLPDADVTAACPPLVRTVVYRRD